MIYDVIESERGEVITRLKVQKLAERKATKVIALNKAVQLWILFFQAHDAGASEDDAQTGILVVTSTQFSTPVGLFEDLVNQEHFSTSEAEFAGKIGQTAALKVKIVHVDVQAFALAHIKMLLSILEEERGLAHTSCALDAYQWLTPVNFVHQGTTHGKIRVFHQISVCSEECFQRIENVSYLLINGGKGMKNP
jgi:hypothetical protein